jgi:hypothetical protein
MLELHGVLPNWIPPKVAKKVKKAAEDLRSKLNPTGATPAST